MVDESIGIPIPDPDGNFHLLGEEKGSTAEAHHWAPQTSSFKTHMDFGPFSDLPICGQVHCDLLGTTSNRINQKKFGHWQYAIRKLLKHRAEGVPS